MATRMRLRLANKCLLFFGLAMLLAVGAALWITWLRVNRLIDDRPLLHAQQLAEMAQSGQLDLPEANTQNDASTALQFEDMQINQVHVSWAFLPLPSSEPTEEASDSDSATPNKATNQTPATSGPGLLWDADPLLKRLATWLPKDGMHPVDANADADNTASTAGASSTSPQALAANQSNVPVWTRRPKRQSWRQVDNIGVAPGQQTTSPSQEGDLLAYAVALPATDEHPAGALLVEVIDPNVGKDVALNRIHILAAGLAAGLIGLCVFGWATTRVILAPVKTLGQYARKAAAGDLNLRADINTRDEFELLAKMLNRMLTSLKSKHDELTAANKSLDLKLGELAESNHALDQANQVKNEFLANVSHELRTPLNSIIGFGEILRETLPQGEDKLSQKRLRYTNNIIQSSQRLLDLITDMLDLAKIEAGRMSLNVSPVSISDTCEGLMNLMKPVAGKKGVLLKLKVEGGLPVLHTDPGKLQQILFNFLSNAVKFTPAEGQVSLTVALLPALSEDAPDEIRFAVTDTGPGIALDDQHKVFEKFNQLDPAVTREHGGTGLGLAISKELADMLQGRIDLESILGHGATFSLTLPITLKARTNVLMPELA